MSKLREIVIAAYNRDLSWLDHLNDIKISIYRKGTPTSDEREIYLPENVGRCVHTFFNHIVSRYDNLADLTYFAQDYPFDHWSNIVECCSASIEEIQSLAALTNGNYYAFDTKDIHTRTPVIEVGTGITLKCNTAGLPHHGGLDLNSYWNLLFEGEPPTVYEFAPAGHFVVTKEHLQLRSKAFYTKIVDLLEKEHLAPWTIERLEAYIFNPKYVTKL